MELQPTKTLTSIPQWSAAVKTIIDRHINTVPENQRMALRALPMNIPTGLIGFLAASHKNAEPQDVAALIIEAWQNSLQSSRGAGHPLFQPMLADFVQYVKNCFGIELPLPQNEQPETEPAPAVETSHIEPEISPRPFINMDERYGDREPCNIDDYRDLNPNGDFIEYSDGIYELINDKKFLIAAIPDQISVTQAATLAACNVSYIRAEIAAGRLPAEKIGSQWVITRDAFDAWMNNPKRGSRQK